MSQLKSAYTSIGYDETLVRFLLFSIIFKRGLQFVRLVKAGFFIDMSRTGCVSHSQTRPKNAALSSKTEASQKFKPRGFFSYCSRGTQPIFWHFLPGRKSTPSASVTGGVLVVFAGPFLPGGKRLPSVTGSGQWRTFRDYWGEGGKRRRGGCIHPKCILKLRLKKLDREAEDFTAEIGGGYMILFYSKIYCFCLAGLCLPLFLSSMICLQLFSACTFHLKASQLPLLSFLTLITNALDRLFSILMALRSSQICSSIGVSIKLNS